MEEGISLYLTLLFILAANVDRQRLEPVNDVRNEVSPIPSTDYFVLWHTHVSPCTLHIVLFCLLCLLSTKVFMFVSLRARSWGLLPGHSGWCSSWYTWFWKWQVMAPRGIFVHQDMMHMPTSFRTSEWNTPRGLLLLSFVGDAGEPFCHNRSWDPVWGRFDNEHRSCNNFLFHGETWNHHGHNLGVTVVTTFSEGSKPLQFSNTLYLAMHLQSGTEEYGLVSEPKVGWNVPGVVQTSITSYLP